MESTIEEKKRMDGSERDLEKPQSGDEVPAAAEDVAKTTEKMAAIVTQIKDIEDKFYSLSKNSQDSESESVGKGPHLGGLPLVPPFIMGTSSLVPGTGDLPYVTEPVASGGPGGQNNAYYRMMTEAGN